MSNNIRADLKLFNQIVDRFLNEEASKPLANRISPKNLYSEIDLSLNDNPSLDNDFRKNLEKLILSTPKSSSKLSQNPTGVLFD